MSTKIDWCDEVWNPTTGCTKGCSYCYARPFADRMRNHPNEKISAAYRHGFTPTCHPERLNIPMHWKKPRRIFVDSMGDLFDPQISDTFIIRVFSYICAEILQRHTYMILTKQAQRMKEFFDTYTCNGTRPWPNIWLGISATNLAEADALIPILLQIPAAVRFVSIEPIMGYVSIRAWCPSCQSFLLASRSTACGTCHTTTLRPDWIICGGQTGPKAKSPDYTWITSLRDECQSGGIPFFFKGWGKHLPGALIDGREWREFPA